MGSEMCIRDSPEIGLRDARALRDIARALVAKGLDPRDQRRLERNAKLLAERTHS